VSTKSGEVAEWRSGEVNIKTFRDMLVWQRGMDLVREVYKSTAQMPRDELFALTSQMRRAATSIPMNIAEGFGQHSRAELLHGLRLAAGSLMELMTAYEIATSLGMIASTERVLELMAEEDRMLNSLIRKLTAKGPEKRASRRIPKKSP